MYERRTEDDALLTKVRWEQAAEFCFTVASQHKKKGKEGTFSKDLAFVGPPVFFRGDFDEDPTAGKFT